MAWGQLTRARAAIHKSGRSGRPRVSAGAIGFGRDLLRLLAVQALNAGKVDPLIRARLEVFAKEDRAAVDSACVLQRQRD